MKADESPSCCGRGGTFPPRLLIPKATGPGDGTFFSTLVATFCTSETAAAPTVACPLVADQPSPMPAARSTATTT